MDMLSDPSIPLDLRIAASIAAMAYVNASAVSIRVPSLENCTATGLAHKALDAAIRAAIYHERRRLAKDGAASITTDTELLCQEEP
jgi:hypothetical protein